MSDPVHEWIEKAFATTANESQTPLMQSKTGNAWDYLRRYRELCDPTDQDLACAEHYMFARYMSSLHPVLAGGMPMAVGAYQLGKVIQLFLEHCGVELGLHYGSHQPTRPSAAQVYWGLRGCGRGTYGDFGILPVSFRGFIEAFSALIK